MNISESFSIAYVNLKSNKTRAFLSMLGIIIGIAAVIVIVSITEGAKQDVLKSIGTADSFIYVINAKYNESTNRQIELKSNDLEMFERLRAKKSVLPKMYKTFEIRTPKKLLKRSISIIDTNYLKTHRLTLLTGRNVNSFDIDQRSRVCLINKKLSKLLFDVTSPIGQIVYCGQGALTVVGIIQSESDESFASVSENEEEESYQPNEFLVPYTTALRLESDSKIDEISLYVDKKYEGNVLQEIKEVIEKNSRSMDDYSVQDPKEILAQIEKQTLLFSTFLASIASISLLVGGVGIMNVMLTSVAERTREIGIRKAIGASQRDILSQFIVEACFICMLGGFIGILIGCTITYLLPILTNHKISTAIVYGSLLVSFSFSLLVGLVFGVFPAVCASKLSPAEALRVE